MKKNYWTKAEWITKLESEPYETCEKARQAFLYLVKNMDGVTVLEDKHGVKLVEVRTKTKLYKYEIHAETTHVKVGEREVTPEDDDFFDDGFDDVPCSYREDIYKQMYVGKVYKNIYNAYI